MAGSSPTNGVRSENSNAYLLDSSVLIPLLRGDVAIKARMDVTAQLYVPSIVLGELYFGAFGSPGRPEAARGEIENVARTITVLVVDENTANIYGRIKHEQKTQGHTMPDNDLWIAALAIQYSLTLAARDAHFAWIQGLDYDQW